MRSHSDHARLVALGDRLAEADAIRAKGACRDIDVAVFFPPPLPHPGSRGRTGNEPDPYAQARRICAGCDVRQQCADFALDGNEQGGMWGGLDPDERAAIRSQRRKETA